VGLQVVPLLSGDGPEHQCEYRGNDIIVDDSHVRIKCQGAVLGAAEQNGKNVKRIAIINPASAAGRTGRSVSAIAAQLEGICDRTVITTRPGHARQAAQESTDFETIVVVGGDGTVHEVLQGMDHNRQSLAVVPSGTGNSLARDLKITCFEEGVRVAKSGSTRAIDMLDIRACRIDGTMVKMIAASTVSFGYATRVTMLANRSLKRLGSLCYPVSAFINTLHPERLTMKITCDDDDAAVETTLTCLLVSNTRHAANFKVFPHASITDGLFDVMELDLGFFRQNLFNISALSSMHFYAPYTLRRVRSMRISLHEPCSVLVDGEIIDDVAECTITILPGKTACFCAP
jgi:diacylglycerol kinase family enzyme